MNHTTLLLLLAAFITACPTVVGGPVPGVQPIKASGGYVHGPSGFSFPERFSAFRRIQINQYDASGTNVGVDYNLERADAQIALTLYVGPPVRDATETMLSLASQFELERANVLQYHPGATVTAARMPPPTQNREATRGYAATFRYSEEFAYRRQEVESLLYLFEYEGWVVEYRITYPSSQEARANPISQMFISSFIWRGGT